MLPTPENAQRSPVPDTSGGYRNAPVSAPIPVLQPPILPELFPGAGALVVDTTALNAAVRAAHDAADVAEQAAGDIQSTINRSGPAPWGDDPALGQVFDGAFSAPHANLIKVLEGLPSLLQHVAQLLDTTGTVLADAEESSAAAAASLTRRMTESATA
jgi:hypothetical protein